MLWRLRMLLCPRWYALQPYLLPDALRLSGLQQPGYPEIQTQKSPSVRMGFFTLIDAWQFPTLAWGDPTLPSALRRFTSEFGMGSGGTTALQPPGKFCLSDRFMRSDVICIKLNLMSLRQNIFGVVRLSLTVH